MNLSPADRLTAPQLMFLEWLVDPRPSSGQATFHDGYVLADDDSPSKGSKTRLGQALGGVTTQAMSNWALTAKFQAAFAARAKAEIQDPSFMLNIVRNVREIASGNGGGREDALKAADLYAKLTGYRAPDELPPVGEASTLSTEQLELISARP